MRLLSILLVLGLAAQVLAGGEEDSRANRSPYRVDLALDLPLSVGAGLIAAVPELLKGELAGPWCGLACDPADLNALDRAVVGNDSALARHFSDALIATNLALPHVAGLVDVLVSDPVDGFAGYGKDTLVILEALAMNHSVNQVVKYAVRRPRPLVYDAAVGDAERSEPDAALSFYSAHSSASFCMATAYSYTFMKRHPDSAWIVPVWLGTHALAATTGVLRVQGGKHFWTDVLAGAAIGSIIGFLVPYLHLDDASVARGPGADATRAGLGVAPLFLDQGIGVAITIR